MNFIKWAIRDELDLGKYRGEFSSKIIYEYPLTTLEIFISENFPKEDIDIISVSRGYPPYVWKEDSDIFFMFKDHIIKKLQEKKCFLMIDNSYEGHSEIEIPIIRSLYYNCFKYNIDPSMIFLIDGNLRSEVYNEIYVNLKKYNKSINIISINGCESQVITNVKSNFDLDVIKSKCLNESSDKIILSLSRRTRQLRLLAQYLLSQKSYKDYIVMSQDTTDENLLTDCKFADFNEKIDFSNSTNWINSLPIKADNTDFSYNYAGDLNQDLYDKTIFSLVLETYQHSVGGTSFFYSEKCFKPVICFQPFIIYGQYGCNYGLKEFGYKTYENYFNLDEFDFEVNPITRLLKISEELDRLTSHLQSLTRNQQIDWRFSQSDILRYNYDHYYKKSYFRKKIKEMIDTMKSIKLKQDKLYWKNY